MLIRHTANRTKAGNETVRYVISRGMRTCGDEAGKLESLGSANIKFHGVIFALAFHDALGAFAPLKLLLVLAIGGVNAQAQRLSKAHLKQEGKHYVQQYFRW